MTLLKKTKRLLSFLLMTVMLAATAGDLISAYAAESVTPLSTASQATSDYVTLVSGGADKLGPHFRGDQSGATDCRLYYRITVVKDVAGSAAYCITPFARGVQPNNQPQTLASVPSEQLDTKDRQLLGIMMAGYPTKTHGRSAEDANMATQIAIQHFVFQNPDKYPNPKNVKFNNDDWSHWEGLSIIELAKTIYNEGIANPYDPSAGGTAVSVSATADNNGLFSDKGETLEMKITLEASGSFQIGKLTLPSEIKNIVKSGKGTITVDGRSVSFKTYILGADDNFEGIEIKPGDKVVTITLDKLSAEAYVPAPGQVKTVEYEFQVAGGESMRAYKGENLDTKNQDYIFLAPGPAEPVSALISWTSEEIPPPDGEPGKGGLKILKYNQKTNTLLSGAIFEIRGVSATNWDFLVHIQASPGAAIPLPDGGTAVTGVGYIELRDIRAGQYQITEISPPPNFDYCDLGVNSKVVTVIEDESGLYPQVRFENNPFASLRIRKIDTVTGAPVSGAILRIRNPLADFDVEMVTMNGGIIELNKLPQGNYEISEVYCTNKYIKSDEVKVATLRWGETTDIVFENQPKTELLVKKIDGDTGEALEGTYFKLTKPDTGDTWEDVTFYDGYAVFQNIPSGTFVLEETKSPEGYILDSTKRTIVVQNYKTNEIVIQNFKKPTLVILKVDEETGQPLPNAEFRVARMSGQIVYEGLTGPDGTIRLEGLSSEWYKITELAPPKGYLIAAEPKDVYFEQGQALEVKFDNRLRPSLEILKIDEETGEPLAGAKFRVWKAEDSTVSEYVTGPDGRIIIHDLDEALYSCEETVAPSGYLLNAQHKDIMLEWGKTKTLVFTNKARPKLRILKVDAVTGQPLPNAEFRVSKVEDATVSEYITGSSGEILIENLDESVYRAEEFMPPDGYLRYDESKEILLEWGKTKTLKFDNIRKPVVIFLKTNALTGKGIPGATFRVEYETPGGGLKNLGSYKTGTDGRIVIPKAEPGWYMFTETLPAPGFSLPNNPVTRMYFGPGDNAYLSEFDRYYIGGANGIYTDSDDNGEDTDNWSSPFAALGIEEHSGSEYYTEGEGFNWPLNSIVIKKTHAVTGELLGGAAFELYRADEQVSGVPGTAIGRYTTDNSGIIVITGLEPGYYVCKEVQAPQNFLISENSQQNGFLKADGTTVLEFTFANYPYGSLLITKVDGLTGKPLAGARFKVTDSNGAVIGNSNGEYVTDSSGEILIPNVKPGAVVVTELQAPANYAVNTTPQTVQIGTDGKTYKVAFDNYPYGAIIIRKMDEKTREPLAGVEFMVTASDGSVVGNSNGVFVTDAQGAITIPNLPKNSYIVTETKTLTTHILENQTRTVAVDYGKTYTLDFYNKPKSGLQIIKIDADTKEPLKGAKFTVYRMNGEIVGSYETNGDGVIILDNLEPSWYKIAETKSPDGFLLDDTPQDVEITHGQFVKVVFENKRIGSLQIKKINESDGSPLAGATFTVTKQNGEYVGEYTTGSDGLISVSVEPGWLVVTEKKAPSGFILDSTPKIVEVKAAIPTVVTFTNKPESGLQIRKINSATRQPIEGVEFSIAKLSGERVGTYKTDTSGLIYVTLDPGQYTVTEVKADGYILDAAPRTVEITWGKPVALEIENTPMSGLLIVKTDEKTGKPLAGVVFDVTRADGQRVTGSISDGNQPGTEANSPNKTTSANGDISGSYTTDANGRILINTLPAGEYHVVERQQLSGYELDTDVHSVTVTPGKLATLQLTNRQKAGMRLLKIDSVTKRGIYNVEFMVFDSNNKVVGTYYTDNEGVIDFSGILPEGRYTIRETRPAANYIADDMPRTVEFVAGKVTEIRWENTPFMGQIQITKKSADDNPINGFPAGTLLADAVFEVYDRAGNKVDTVRTNKNGWAATKTLPLGRYTIREAQAPAYYSATQDVIDAEIEFSSQIVRITVLNKSTYTNVSVTKRGYTEVVPGQSIKYDFKNIANNSTVPLDGFYWRDTLPTDAVRLDKIVTGTWSNRLSYKIVYKTNLSGGDYRTLSDNLSTEKVHTIAASPAALGLAANEFVTEVMFVFGRVPVGFRQVEAPYIYCNVLPNLAHEYRFTNKTDVGGLWGNQWIMASDRWVSVVYNKTTPPQLPRTGY